MRDADFYNLQTRVSALEKIISEFKDHADHGRGDAVLGPEDSDCPCRATRSQSVCASFGCGFCRSASRKENSK